LETFDQVISIRKLNDMTNRNVLAITNMVESIAASRGVPTGTDPTPHSIIVAVGGDGTMLEAMRLAQRSGAYVIGVNMGNVGFLSELSAKDRESLKEEFQRLFSDQWRYYHRIETRWFIRAKLSDNSASVVAGNEVSVAGEKSDEMIRYQLLIDGADAGIHRANSLLVATPTGSTAYSMSAGGALMVPNMKALQIVPVAPFTLTSRPIIVSGSSTIQIRAWGAKVAVRLDGNERYVADRSHTQEDPYVVRIDIDDHGPVNMVHAADWNYFNVLTEKLGWQREDL